MSFPFNHSWNRLVVATLLCAVQIAPLVGSETRQVNYEKYEDFVRGKANGVTLTQEGTITLSPTLKKIADLASPFLWDCIFDREGNLYVSAGEKARVWKITPSGEVKEFYSGEETNIFAMAINSKDELFIATSPQGKVLKLGKDGAATVYFSCPEKNIFALLFDDDDHLYVATGDKGIIYKVTAENKSEVFFDSDEPNIVSLAWDKTKKLLAGSQGTGLLYRINTADQSSYVLLSSGQKEVKKIAVTPEGIIYAVILDGVGENKTPEPTPAVPNTFPFNQQGQDSSTPAAATPPAAIISGGEGGPGQAETGAAGKGGSSELYIITPDDLSQKIWTSKFTAHSLSIRKENALVGTGDDGYLFEIDPRGRANLLLKIPSSQITRITSKPDGQLYLTGSNLGAIWSLSSAKAGEGIYESEVFNAKLFVNWGVIRVESTIPTGTSVSVFSRSGNTPSSDKSWSVWKPLDQGRITSPNSQYLQFKLVLKGDPLSPEIDDVHLFYQPFNLPPQISDVTIIPSSLLPFPIQINAPGMTPAMIAAQISGMQVNRNYAPPNPENGQPDMIMPQAPKQLGAPPRGLHFAFWKASDPNQDNLLYEVLYQMPGDQSWRRLAEKLDAPLFAWDSTGWPDGNYLIKIIANDSLSNPPSEVKTAEDISRQFRIDNTSPVLKDLKVNGQQAAFIVADQLSVLKSVTASINGIDYFPIAPAEGILDAPAKSFNYTAPNGVNRVFIRMEDVEGNIGAAKIDFK